MGIFLTEFSLGYSLFWNKAMPFIGGRLQIQANLISINQERSLRIVGYALAHRLILFLLNQGGAED